MNGILSALKGRWTLWIIALFFSFVAGFGALSILGSAADRVPYYVATADMAAGTQITTDIVTEKTAPADAVPPTALTLADIQNNTLFAKVALKAGSVIQLSVISKEGGPTADLPDGYVLTSMLIPPANAVAGRVTRGDYVDVAAVIDGTARIVMQHVLVVDVTVNPASIAQAATTTTTNPATGETTTGSGNSSALYAGVASLYTFAVSPEDFAKIAVLGEAKVYLALSATKTPASLDVAVYQDTLGLGGVKPSYPVKNMTIVKLTKTGKPALTGDAAKDAVAFFNFYTAQGASFSVSTGDRQLLAEDPDTRQMFDAFPLNGANFDIVNGVYLPKG